MSIFWIALASISLSVAAQFALKAGMSSQASRMALAEPLGWHTVVALTTQAQVVGGFALYGLGAVAWLAVLSRWDVSKAYPLVGLGFALTVFVALFAGEQVTVQRMVGVALICAGVALVARS